MMAGKILVTDENGIYLLKLIGDVRMTLCASLNSYIEAIFHSDNVKDVLIDLQEVEGVDSTTLGLLAKLAISCEQQYGIKPTVFCNNEGIFRIFVGMGLEDVFDIVRDAPETLANLKELDAMNADVDQMRQHVLEAHRLLSLLNSNNKSEFVNLIRSLEHL